MKKLDDLLNENKYWYLNNYCMSQMLEEDKAEDSYCETCGDYNGTIAEGTIRDFLLENIADVAWSTLREYMDADKYKLTFGMEKSIFYTISPKNNVIKALMEDTDFQYYTSYNVVIEDEHYNFNYEDIPKDIVIEGINKVLVDK